MPPPAIITVHRYFIADSDQLFRPEHAAICGPGDPVRRDVETGRHHHVRPGTSAARTRPLPPRSKTPTQRNSPAAQSKSAARPRRRRHWLEASWKKSEYFAAADHWRARADTTWRWANRQCDTFPEHRRGEFCSTALLAVRNLIGSISNINSMGTGIVGPGKFGDLAPS